MLTKAEEVLQALRLKVQALEIEVETLKIEAAPVRDLSPRVAMLEHRLEELTKSRELWGQRGWGVLMILLTSLSSILGVIVGALLNAYLVTKK